MANAVLWRRNDIPGHEYSRLEQRESSWLLSGVAIFEYERLPCRLDYAITCDRSWHTKSANVTGRVGDRTIESRIEVDPRETWTLSGAPCPEVRGCIDVDLNFSPSTNLLPIRRLGLAIGQSAVVRAAWLRFPGFTLEPLDQTYTRTGERTYRYESSTGFVAEIVVNESGLPVSYGDIWS